MRTNAARICRWTLFGLALVAPLMLARPAVAQQRPSPVLELAVGKVYFGDDGVVIERLMGGAARVYLSPRVSVGPELGVIRGEHHSHLVLTGNLMFDVLAPVNGQPRLVTPFVVVGGGLFRTQEQFFNQSYAHNEGAFTTGGGLRVRVGEYVTAGVEGRLGWELHFRLNAVVGVRLKAKSERILSASWQRP